MRRLTTEQIESIPWNSKYVKGEGVPREPLSSEVKSLLEIPFVKRNSEYALFYCWNEIIEMIPESKSKILDTACGRGQIAQVLHYYGHEMHACDKEEIFGGSNEIIFRKTDLNERFPYDDSVFDYVLNSTALHYLKDIEHYFTESKRILKPGGYAVFSIPNIGSYSNRFNFLKTGRIPEYSSSILNRRSFIYPDYLFKLLESMNFTVEEIRGVVPNISIKIRLIDFFFGRIICGDKSDYEKYSPILVIKVKVKK